MVSKVQPGAEARARMAVYDRMAAVGFIRDSYAGKFALAAFVGIMVPLAIFTGWLLVSRTSVAEMYPVLAALFLACFAGFLGTLWMLRELLMPVELTAEALRTYIETRRLPDLPLDFPDRAGRLMEGTQYTLTQLHETISRLERISDAEDLTGSTTRARARSAWPRNAPAPSATCRPSRSRSSTSTISAASTRATATAPGTPASPTWRRCCN